MANNIEWSHASRLPAIVDPDDIPSTYEGLGVGEVGVWLGSDGANILYGTKEQMLDWAEDLITTIQSAKPVPDPMDGNLIAVLNSPMYGTSSVPGEYVDWSAPDLHTIAGWRSMLDLDIEDYAACYPHMIVFVVDEETAEALGYDWQDDAIGAMR